jgi:hypothetical protein
MIYLFKVSNSKELSEIKADSYIKAERIIKACMSAYKFSKENHTHKFVGTKQEELFTLPCLKPLGRDAEYDKRYKKMRKKMRNAKKALP